VADFRRIVGRMPRHDDAMFYDAVMVLGHAIRVAGADREAVRRFLADLGHEEPAYLGVTGPITFGPESRRPLLMVQLVRDQTVVVSR
jgi:ABC-type branched-subunit amino acid transport system substrate-binding protein